MLFSEKIFIVCLAPSLKAETAALPSPLLMGHLDDWHFLSFSSLCVASGIPCKLHDRGGEIHQTLFDLSKLRASMMPCLILYIFLDSASCDVLRHAARLKSVKWFAGFLCWLDFKI